MLHGFPLRTPVRRSRGCGMLSDSEMLALARAIVASERGRKHNQVLSVVQSTKPKNIEVGTAGAKK